MEDFDFSVKLKTKVSLGKNLGELWKISKN
jgi:hypothetical protein